MFLACLTLVCGAASCQATAPWETWQPPAVTLPDPNGFDTYLKAFALKAEIDRQHGLGPGSPGPGMAGGPVAPRPPDEWGEGPVSLPLADRVALYAPVLKLTREALPMQCAIPPPKGYDDLLPFFAEFRAVARLLRMEAHALLEAGDPAGAANSALDCLQMAQACATHRTLVGFLVGAACEAYGLKALDEAILQLDAEACRACLARLARIESLRVPLAEVLGGEECCSRLAFKELMTDPGKLQEFADAVGMDDTARALFVQQLGAGSWQAMDDYWAQVRTQAAKPYRERSALPEPTDPFLTVVAPVIGRVWLKEAATEASFRLRQAQIAAQGFLCETEKLPQALEELAPAWLPAVPADPFGEGPLEAFMNADGLTIYSVGPDGNDDGGMAIEGTMNEDSVGDMVVRVPKV